MTGRARALRLPLIAIFAAIVLVAPVLGMTVLSTRAVADQLAARAGHEREQTAEVVGRLIAGNLRNAGRDLVSRHHAVATAFASSDVASLTRELEGLRASSPLYATVAGFDPAGRMLARVPHQADVVGQSFAERDYFIGALRTHEPYVSEVFRSVGAPFNPLVAVAFAIQDDHGIYGVLQVTLAPADVLTTFDPVANVPGREIVVTDRNARVIASTDPARPPLSLAPDVGGAFSAAAGIPGVPWRVHIVDTSTSALTANVELDEQLRLGFAASAAATIPLALLLALLYAKLMRQRDVLASAQRELIAANAELRQAGKAKSAFLADMSHELRTPMNAILGFSDLLMEQLGSTLSERHRRFFTNIHVAGQHLLGLINDVLDLSKVEAGRLDMRPEIIETEALLLPAAESARRSAATAGLAFEFNEHASGLVRLDVTKTRQIVFNLLSNAVKFTPAPGTVSLTANSIGDSLLLEVTDTGIGIPGDAQHRVFGIFERVNRERSDAQGTGLGLALTKRLVELQGGTISFTSAPGQGTTFTVVLPEARYRVMASGSVLIVEDDRSDAELIAVLANDLGLPTHRVTTLAGALEATGRARPLAVILDLFLPDGHGSAILEMLKSSPETSDVPVLVVTSTTDVARFRLMGADCMTKPIDNSRLRAWLNGVVAPPIAA